MRAKRITTFEKSNDLIENETCDLPENNILLRSQLYPQKPQEALAPISYRGALLSTLLHATVYVLLHNLLNVLVRTANKMGLHKKMEEAKMLTGL
jgi:hypothetical protein